MTPRPRLTAISVVALFVISLACSSSQIEPDEEVLLFRTHGTLDTASGHWRVPAHGWIFEREENSAKRSLLLDALEAVAGAAVTADSGVYFDQRSRLFLVDSERNKVLTVELGGERFELEPSGPNGHFRGTFTTSGEPGMWVRFQMAAGGGDPRVFEGQAQLLAAEGISVVSDIDDTIKISEVLDRARLVEHTFFLDFEPVPGMASAYTEWQNRGAAFHYVSSSPWQLYPPLLEFVDASGFPRGTMHLRDFRPLDASGVEFFGPSQAYKTETIAGLLQSSNRTIVLVGDAGEADPEVYGELARAYPDRISHIFIRRVAGADNGDQRFAAAFSGLAQDRWTVFEDPAELETFTW